MIEFENLFVFPIALVDGENEEKKRERNKSLALDESEEVDIVIGEAEVPYYDFISVTDRWLPSQRSLDKALNGKFDACYVVFANSGGFVVPWNKQKFKEKLKEFISKLPESDVKATEIGIEDAVKLFRIDIGGNKNKE